MKAFLTISFWKMTCLSGCLLLLINFSSFAQCSGASSITYDSLVVGSGNDAHNFTIKQFDPSLGTLISVDVSSVVSVNYGFTLTNINSSPINFSVAVGRRDNIQSVALVTPYNNTINANIGTYNLNPNQSITESPSTVIDRYTNTVNVSGSIVDFMGRGTVGFAYAPRTYANNSGSPTYSYSATANDSIHFYVTYNYCDNIVLASSIAGFSARKIDDKNVGISWISSNERPGRLYDIEKSTDQNNFSSIGAVLPSLGDPNADYAYTYSKHENENERLYFRLKITDINGVVSYSEVRMVDMSKSFNGIYLYPNPSDQFINITLNQAGSNSWQVEILSVNGSILQRNNFSNTNNVHIIFLHKLAPAVYFVRLTERETLKNHVLSFMVR